MLALLWMVSEYRKPASWLLSCRMGVPGWQWTEASHAPAAPRVTDASSGREQPTIGAPPWRRRPSQPPHLEGVAARHHSGRQALAEPADALRAGAVGEGFGHHHALTLALQRVVADARGGVQALLHVARLEPVARLVRMVRPHTGQAVGLQLEPHRQRVGLRLGGAAAHRVHLLGHAEQTLHVVADLVRDDVSLREVARRAELLAQRVEEAEVDVDLLVGRAVERPHRRLPDAARGAGRAAEQHQPRRLILPATAAELLGQ